MPIQLIVALLVIFQIGIIIQAYNMGWNAGHDIHHDDSIHSGPKKDDDIQPPTDTPIWR